MSKKPNLIKSFTFVALFAVGLNIAAQAQDLTSETLAEGLTLIRGAGGNVLVKAAEDGGLLVVDGGSAEQAETLLATIRELTGTDQIEVLINTHWHPEQTGLNRLVSEDTTILAHENTRQWLSREIQRFGEEQSYTALPPAARPNQSVHHYGELEHGGETVRYGLLRQAHTDGDLYVWFTDANVLHGGGVVTQGSWPRIDWWTGGSIQGLAAAFDYLTALVNEETRIVPAEGEVLNYQDLQTMREMYQSIAQQVRRGFSSALSAEEQVEAGPADAYEDKMGNADDFIRQAHESLVPHITPDA